MFSPTKPLSLAEFVVLLAFMTSILALSIDAMLPALGEIARDLELENVNDAQHVVTAMFFGFALGQILAGPLSDSYGRRPVIFGGYLVFIIGCLLSTMTQDFTTMLLGRVLQGLGAAAPRIVGLALVRDGYEGRAMARIMSFVMAIFILVPAVAPAIGQSVMAVSHWRMIFMMLLVVAMIAFFWFATRQPETLTAEKKRPFSITGIASGAVEALSIRQVWGYTLASGAIFGCFLGYLNSAQQIFQDVYGTGEWFALWFALGAAAIGVASVVNSRFVIQYGMRYISFRAIALLALTAFLLLGFALASDGKPPFWAFMAWLVVTLFCLGGVFGNFNALAMEPLGHMAGLGAAVVGAFSTLIALPFGLAIGAAFQNTITPMITGFVIMGLATLLIMWWTDRPRDGVSPATGSDHSER